MPRRFRHPELGEYLPLDLTKGGVGSVMVSDAEIRGLVGYLNDAVNHDADRAVLELLEEMLELDKMDRPLWGETKGECDIAIMVTKAGRTVPNPVLRKIAPEKYRQELAITERTDQINRELRKYRFLPRAWSTGQTPWIVMWEVLPNTSRKSRLRDGLFRLNDGMALRMILDFARAGYLNRLRRCLHCRKWLYAKFRHQDFCSTKCQQKHYAISPEWRAKRRDYMRRYRNRFY
jgi:hypothetical protein